MAFTTLMMFHMFNVLNCITEEESLFSVGVFSNKYLIGAILISVLLQVTVIYTPLSVFFKTVPLSLFDWAIIILVASTGFIYLEIHKLVTMKKRKC